MLTLKGSLRGWLILGKSWCWIMDSIHPSVRALLGEIERALDAKLYYSAIAVALSVPDVCASLELDPAVPGSELHALHLLRFRPPVIAEMYPAGNWQAR